MTCEQIIESFLIGKRLTIYAREVVRGEYAGKYVGYYTNKTNDDNFFKFIPIETTIKAIDFNNRELRNAYGDIILLKLEQLDGEVLDFPIYEYTNLELTK